MMIGKRERERDHAEFGAGVAKFFSRLPFNKVAHALLTDQGAFIHTHFEADFDGGDAENGPRRDGHDAYDLYEGESHDIVIDRSGLIVHVGLIEWDVVRFFEGWRES